MNLKYYARMGLLSALAVGGGLLSPTQVFAQEQGVEELTRGPVHEAFAASISSDPEPGMFVKIAPPGLIEEVPPEQQLEGDNVAWIPGYWGWDEEENDFIWISGVWRNLPPGRQWVPGYWGEEGSQWQWTSGYWANDDTEEVAYLPKPPKSIESGPNVEAPSSSHIWVSGTWVQREERYAWRPGYWEAGQQNWIWAPAHYQWTPRGYVFIDGYWDHNVVSRGVVFAPVHFHHDYYSRPNYSYTPLTVISLAVFTNHLFIRPNYGHYYYGDYYAPRYRNEGFYASFSYRSGRNGYDPLYAHSRWEHRDNHDWERQRRNDFDFYRDNESARPPRTWAAMRSRPEDRRRGDRDNYEFAQPLSRYAERRDGGQKFKTLSKDNRDKLVEQRQEMRKYSQERQKIENRKDDQPSEGSDKKVQAKREKFGKSPVVAKRADQLAEKDAPPKRKESRDANDGKKKDGPDADGKPNKPDMDKPAKNKDPDANDGKKKDGPDASEKPNKPDMDKPGKNKDSDADQGRKDEPKMKDKGQENSRPSPKAENQNDNKPEAGKKTSDDGPQQPKKQAAKPEPRPKATPEAVRRVEPNTEGKKKQQAQQPQQAKPQRQVNPNTSPAASKKKAAEEEVEEEDSTGKKKKNR